MNIIYQFNILDFILLIVCIFFLIKGFNKGFIQEFTGIISIILALWLAYLLYRKLGNLLLNYMNSQELAFVIAYIIIFCGVIIIFTVISGLLEKYLGISFNGWLNWLGGGIIGALKGIILCVIIVSILDYIAPSKPFVIDSQVATFVREHNSFLRTIMIQYMDNLHL